MPETIVLLIIAFTNENAGGRTWASHLWPNNEFYHHRRRNDKWVICFMRFSAQSHTGKLKILVVQNADLLIIILSKISCGLAQNTKLHVSPLCQVVQNTGGPKIENTDGARATSVF